MTTSRELTHRGEWAAAFPLFQTQYPWLDLGDFLERIETARSGDMFKIVGVFGADGLLAVAACRLMTSLTEGLVMSIEELIVAEDAQGRGIGSELILFLENFATTLNCSALWSRVSVDSEDAEDFYEQLGWSLKAYSYEQRLKHP